jgi:hypothetical protein
MSVRVLVATDGHLTVASSMRTSSTPKFRNTMNFVVSLNRNMITSTLIRTHADIMTDVDLSSGVIVAALVAIDVEGIHMLKDDTERPSTGRPNPRKETRKQRKG